MRQETNRLTPEQRRKADAAASEYYVRSHYAQIAYWKRNWHLCDERIKQGFIGTFSDTNRDVDGNHAEINFHVNRLNALHEALAAYRRLW